MANSAVVNHTGLATGEDAVVVALPYDGDSIEVRGDGVVVLRTRYASVTINLYADLESNA
jgi:hypothetical protein